MTLDNSKQIEYNFYNILAIQSNLLKGKHFSYEGRENEPNVIMKIHDETKSYVCKNLYIFASKKHNVDGELLIETQCTCNYDKKVYLRFLLSTNRFSDNTQIDKLISNNSSNVEVNLNSVLPNSDNCIYKENDDGIIITFQKPIVVKSMFHNFVENPVEIEEKSSFFENFSMMNTKIKENFTMSVSGELIECHEGEGEEAAMGEAVKKQYDMSVENLIGIYSIIIFVIIIAVIYYSLKIVFTLLYRLIITISDILGINPTTPQIKFILMNFFAGLFFAIAAYLIIMKFIFGVSAEDTELIDGLEEGADIVSRLSKKTKITPDIWYTIIFLALTAGSYYGVRVYLNDKFKDVKGVEKTNLDSILEEGRAATCSGESCSNDANQQGQPGMPPGQPGAMPGGMPQPGMPPAT